MTNMHLLEAGKADLNVTYYLTEIRDKVRQEKERKKAREGAKSDGKKDGNMHLLEVYKARFKCAVKIDGNKV
jgi:hypothetical protein